MANLCKKCTSLGFCACICVSGLTGSFERGIRVTSDALCNARIELCLPPGIELPDMPHHNKVPFLLVKDLIEASSTSSSDTGSPSLPGH